MDVTGELQFIPQTNDFTEASEKANGMYV